MSTNYNRFLEGLNSVPLQHTSIPFWSWNNELDESELLRQIDEFKAVSIKGFIMHARTGLKTPYLGEKWFSAVEACLKKARAEGLEAWVYDENGWPSGFAGGLLLKNESYRAQFLTYEIKDEFDGNAAGVYSLNGDGSAKRLREGDKAEKYHCVYVHTDKSNTDILNPEVTDEFIRVTYDEYYKRFKDSFGKELKGFFTDEPQYFRWGTPYTRMLINAFKTEYNEDVFDGLIYVFLKGKHADLYRYRYYFLLNKLFTENFYKKIYDWCEERGCYLTGHAIEETSLAGQMVGCAGCMPSYMYEHIPGVDWLGRNNKNILLPKQVGSVAAQTGKKLVLTETFGCSGHDTSFLELRAIAEAQYIFGVNKMCQHLTNYSMSGQGKYDHPPTISHHAAWWKDFKIFNDYFNSLSFLLSNSKEKCNTLVIHPMTSAYLEYDRHAHGVSVKKQDENFSKLLDKLNSDQIQFHLGDEIVLKEYAKTEGAAFYVGEMSYDYVIVPDIDVISSHTYKLISDYIKNGGKIIFNKLPQLLDGMPHAFAELKSTCAYEDINIEHKIIKSKNADISVSLRTHEDLGEYLYIYNRNMTCDAEILFASPHRLLDLEGRVVKEGRGSHTVPKGGSIFLLIDDNADITAAARTQTQNMTDKFCIESTDDNNLTVDFVSVSLDGKNYDEPYYVYAANEKLIKAKYNGPLYLKYFFNSKAEIKDVKLIFERLKFHNLKFNGKEITPKSCAYDINYLEAEIDIKKGKNIFEQKIEYYQKDDVSYILYGEGVTESLKNCIIIDTEIESIYIKGKFLVDSNRNITPYALPKNNFKLQENGFPYFSGTVKYTGEISKYNNAKLYLKGRYSSFKIRINGKAEITGGLNDFADLSGLLSNDKNTVEIELTSSLRNMLGPHHYAPIPEPLGVGRFQFAFLGSWKENEAAQFTKEYNLVNFGLESIELIFN